ncbi:MAG: glycerophosphodiester phosphodiesterase family protein [Planctomycetia bacterium]|nr:glycerophosphodiester phosphodiesterase family protein [Planctomycetia bacterium]
MKKRIFHVIMTVSLSVFSLTTLSFSLFGAEKVDPFAPPQEGGPRAVLIQFHRGGGNIRPDNTLETFLWAWGRGGIPEADCRLTKDGVAIAFHDDNLKRLGRGMSEEVKNKRIAELTWDEIKNIDVGSYLSPEFSTQRISTIEAVFASMMNRPERLLYVDEKGASPELIAKLAEKYGVQEQIIFASTNYDLIVRWKKIAPKSKTIHWMGSWSSDVKKSEEVLQKRLDALEKVNFEGIDILQIHVQTDLAKEDPFAPSSEFLRRASEQIKSHGIIFQSLSWTQGNNPETYRRLLDLGVQSFATDWPEECLEGCGLK